MALVVVMVFLLILGALATCLQFVTSGHLKMARCSAEAEKAFCVAEAGVEQAAQYLANGTNVPASFVGSVGEGTYVATVISGASVTDSWHTVGGQININPNNSATFEFSVTLPDGSTITRDTLTTDYAGYTGPATFVHTKPKGSQSALLIDGVSYAMNNNSAYDFLSDIMSVNIYNDNVNTNTGKAMGKWWISIAASESSLAIDGVSSGGSGGSAGLQQYSLLSVGTVRGQSRIVMRESVRHRTWAEYAMWMNNNNGIYFKAGEKIYGKIFSNDALGFSGNPEFFGSCSSAASTYFGSTASCLFHGGFYTGVPAQTLQAIDFPTLLSSATLTLQGATTIALSGNRLLITNTRQGWTSYAVSCATPQVIYIKTSTSGTTSTRPGDCSISGTLDGRVTVVCERDANITGHILYTDNPATNAASNDALGIITKRDIVVTTSAPNNLTIQAHMIATGQYDTSSSSDGSFGVASYDSGTARGSLTVFGGIIQDDRGAVGTFDSSSGVTTHGYTKNYTYDTRFELNPPPAYPPISNKLTFGIWKEH